MHITESYTPESVISVTKVITFEGEARSGKGTSARTLRDTLNASGRSAKIIDQGLKFRSLAHLGLGEPDADELYNDPAMLGDFITDPGTQERMLALLKQVADMDLKEKEDLLYNTDVAKASQFIGQNPHSHPIAISLLFSEVRDYVRNGIDTVLVDGRCMDKYGKQMAKEHIAQYVMGFYVRCDASVAATRSLGKIVDHKEMTLEQKDALLEEITRIRDRNRADTLRSVDPMREPHGAYALSLHDFAADCPDFVHGETLDALRAGMVTMDTSYTRSIEEMTVPVVALATHAPAIQDGEYEKFTKNPQSWDTIKYFQPYERRLSIANLAETAVVEATRS